VIKKGGKVHIQIWLIPEA